MLDSTISGVARASKVAALLGIGKATVWRWAALGILPRPIRLSNRCSVWRLADLQEFIERQAARQGGAS